MLVTLLRHGEVEGRAQVLRGRSNPPLTAQGRKQMQQVWQASTPTITHIVSSPLQRCWQFAEEQAQQHSLPLMRMEELREIDFGDWEELTLAEAEAHNADSFVRFQHDTWQWQPPRGETYRDFRARLRHALSALQQLRTSHLFVVTHGGVIRALLAELLALTPASAARIGMPLAGYCQLWLDEHDHSDSAPRASLLRLQWLEAICT